MWIVAQQNLALVMNSIGFSYSPPNRLVTHSTYFFTKHSARRTTRPCTTPSTRPSARPTTRRSATATATTRSARRCPSRSATTTLSRYVTQPEYLAFHFPRTSLTVIYPQACAEPCLEFQLTLNPLVRLHTMRSAAFMTDSFVNALGTDDTRSPCRK